MLLDWSMLVVSTTHIYVLLYFIIHTDHFFQISLLNIFIIDQWNKYSRHSVKRLEWLNDVNDKRYLIVWPSFENVKKNFFFETKRISVWLFPLNLDLLNYSHVFVLRLTFVFVYQRQIFVSSRKEEDRKVEKITH